MCRDRLGRGAKPGRGLVGDQHGASTVPTPNSRIALLVGRGGDHAADETARPARLAAGFCATSRGRSAAPGPSAPVRQSTMWRLPVVPSAARPPSVRQLDRLQAMAPTACGTAPRAAPGPVGKAIGGTPGWRGSGRAAPPSHSPRPICQMPSPIIVATAAATMSVGMSGSRRDHLAIRPSRACMAIFLDSSNAALPTAARRRSAAARPEATPDAPTRAARKRSSTMIAPTVDDRADDQDQEGRRPVADIERWKSSPQARQRGEAHRPVEQARRAAARAQPRQAGPRQARALHGISRGPARPSRPRHRSTRTGTARRRRRNASTRRPPRSRNAASG